MNYEQQSIEIIASLDAHLGLMTEDFVKLASGAWMQAFPLVGGLLVDERAPTGCTFDSLANYNEATAALHERLRTCPRGTWTHVAQRMPEGTIFNDVFMADGRGDYVMLSSTGAVSREAVLERLLHDEIGAARERYRRYRKAHEAEVLLAARGWRSGTILRRARVGGKLYGAVAIQEIRADGAVVVEATSCNGRRIETIKCMPQLIDAPAQLAT